MTAGLWTYYSLERGLCFAQLWLRQQSAPCAPRQCCCKSARFQRFAVRSQKPARLRTLARWLAQIRCQLEPPALRASAQLWANSPSPAVSASQAEFSRSTPRLVHLRANWFGLMLHWLHWCVLLKTCSFTLSHASGTQEDAFRESECTFIFTADSSSSEEVVPELFIQDGAAMHAVQGLLCFPALAPHTQATRTLWARWTQACAPHDVAVSLTCSTAKGQALLETRALVRLLPFTGAVSDALSAAHFQMPLVQAAFELQPTFTSQWQQHCLLPGAAPHAVLALGERAVLNASLRATGDLIICDVELETDACWASRVSRLLVKVAQRLTLVQAQATGALPQDVTANDCFLQSFELTPSAAGLHPSPGTVSVRWKTPSSAALGLPDVVSRLPLPSASDTHALPAWPPG